MISPPCLRCLSVCLSSVLSLSVSPRLPLLGPFFYNELLQPLSCLTHSAPSSGASDAGPVVNPDPPRPSPPVRHLIFCVSLIRHLSLRSSPLLIVPTSRSPLIFALAFLLRSPLLMRSCHFCALSSRSLILCASFLLFSHFLTCLLVLFLFSLIPTLVLFPFVILALHATSTPLQLLLFLSPLPLLHTLLIVRVPPLVLLHLIFLLFFTSLFTSWLRKDPHPPIWQRLLRCTPRACATFDTTTAPRTQAPTVEQSHDSSADLHQPTLTTYPTPSLPESCVESVQNYFRLPCS